MTTSAPRPAYLDSLTRVEPSLSSADNVEIQIWELTVPTDSGVLSEWADRFREAYCPDSQIDTLRDGTGLSRADYLTQLVFPSQTSRLGPAVRAGDFTELLVSDFLESEYGVWVPREKYHFKPIPDSSAQGVDVLGLLSPDPDARKPDDTLIVCEVKASLAGSAYADQLQKAIADNAKDYLRVAFTLNATKRRLSASGDAASVQLVQRFQNRADYPYRFLSTAAAVLDAKAFDANSITRANTAAHNNRDHLSLLVIRGAGLMKLVHSLYADAASAA